MINISVGDVWQLAAEISSNLERLTNEIGIGKIQGQTQTQTPTKNPLLVSLHDAQIFKTDDY